MGKNKDCETATGFTRSIADKVHFESLKKLRKEKDLNLKNSVEYKRSVRRNKINQFLTLCNKTRPEQRIDNTKAFVELLCKMIVKEWSEVVKDEQTLARIKSTNVGLKPADLNKFVNHYSAHVQNLIKFDNEMVNCDVPLCKTSMIEVFLTEIKHQLPVLYSRFAQLILDKTEQLSEINTKEA